MGDPLQNFKDQLGDWGVPGFRSDRGWKQLTASAAYGFTGLVLMNACSGIAVPKTTTQPAPNVQATVNAAVQATTQAQSRAQVQPTARPAQPTATRAPAATATPAVSEEAKARAVELLGSAVSKKQEGELGIAIELTNQALGTWKDYPDAKAFQAELIPQATAQAKEAQAQATAAAEQAKAQATAAAKAAAEEAARAAAQARAEATAAAGLGRVGQRAEASGVAVTVHGVRRAQSVGSFSRADSGKVYVVADVTVQNTTRDKVPYNPLYFKVKDADGFEYNPNIFMDGQGLKSGELAKGEQARGSVAFEVPTGARGLIMSHQPLVIFGGYQTIRIRLE